jgi:CobQ/CobB/MinD/ParA nucleotide binding domain
VQTVAFYSYKGGVGRTSLLSLAARWLAEGGKKVVAVDFDWEAPGLHYKLPREVNKEGDSPGGAVPYLLATARGAQHAPPLEEHSYEVTLGDPPQAGWLKVIPAGPAPQKDYWTALKRLQDELPFTEGSGRGLLALLDFQARIEEDLQPDYLLIDARTGVTELGSLATTLLADTVVCLTLGNRESLEGTLVIVEAIAKAPRLGGNSQVRLVPVICRLPGPRPAGAYFDPELVARLEDISELQAVLMTNNSDLALAEAQGALERFRWEPSSSDLFSNSVAKLFALLFPANDRIVRRK